jgi:hypothetical protein
MVISGEIYTVESLQSHWVHHSSTRPVVRPFAYLMRDRGSIPRGKLVWPESSVSVVSLHWWPQRDWSLWPCLRWASSQTVARPLCRQCDNPTWSHTALLSRFHASCRSFFRLYDRHSRLLGGTLRRACNLTGFIHSSTGPVVYPFASRHEGPGFNPQWVLMWNRDSPVSIVSLQYIIITLHIF